MTRNESGRGRREEPAPSEGAPLVGRGLREGAAAGRGTRLRQRRGVGVCVLGPWGSRHEIGTTPTPTVTASWDPGKTPN